jgi:hypothetical protein
MMSSMRKIATLLVAFVIFVSAPVLAQDGFWTKILKDRTKRDGLHDAFLKVRGDSGKWNDEPQLQVAPTIQQKPTGVSLDDWADQLLEKESQLTSASESWLLFRTQQLDDNDRVWIERIERRGNQFTVVVSQAVWQGSYRKDFTYFNVYGINLGKLESGKYQAKWLTKPLVFSEFDGVGRPQDNWPKNERATDQESTDLSISFTVIAASQ